MDLARTLEQVAQIQAAEVVVIKLVIIT